ncbi:MAG: hypothetical protein JWL72_339 [Ilumatobacteraceae bacterium]|nr:hypothetical protein [Ilumatobacteraceae bacterium]
MHDLKQAIHDQADTVGSRPDLADVMRRVERRRREVRRIGVAGAGVLAVLCVAGVVVIGGRDTAPTTPLDAGPVGSTASEATAPSLVSEPGGLALGGVATGTALDRHDSGALAGPWSVIVRGPNGSLATDSAIVTFPDEAPGAALRPVMVGDVAGSARDGAVIWKISGQYARVQGDLPEADLIRIAEAVTIATPPGSAPFPTVAPISGFTIGAPEPYRSPSVHEMRYYDSAAVGEGAALGNGLTYTGVYLGAWFEDQLLLAHATTSGTVQSHPAVVSAVQGGNGTLAWEPSPGVVVYIGYSGGALDGLAAGGLAQLGERSSLISTAAWDALHPQVVEQSNG